MIEGINNTNTTTYDVEIYSRRKILFEESLIGKWSHRRQWRFRVKHSNGRIIAVSSESYNNRADCINACRHLFASSNSFVFNIESK